MVHDENSNDEQRETTTQEAKKRLEDMEKRTQKEVEP